MATRTPTRRNSTAPRLLREWAAPTPGAALKVDRDKRVIYGVRVLGHLSKNSHGHPKAENGTEYTRGCMEDACRLYEGAEVLCNHDLTPTGGQRRGVEDVLGVLRNVRVEEDKDGPCNRADLHYYESHPMSGRLVEEAERGVGGMGLSHDARAERERFDPAARRLVIERLAAVNSVDLVRRPATNRSLAESRETTVKKTLRERLEALTLTPVRAKWRKRLLEDDGMAPAMDAPVEGVEDGDGVDAGIKAAAVAIIDDDSLDAAGKVAKLKTLLTAHEKISGAEEPAEPVKEEETDGEKAEKGEEDDGEADKEKTEAIKERDALKAEKEARKLCETLGFNPTAQQSEDLARVADPAARRRLAESLKATAGKGRPTSSGPPAGGNPAKKTGKDFLSAVTN